MHNSNLSIILHRFPIFCVPISVSFAFNMILYPFAVRLERDEKKMYKPNKEKWLPNKMCRYMESVHFFWLNFDA